MSQYDLIKNFSNYDNDIQFYHNITELLKIREKHPDFSDYIYVTIGNLYKKYYGDYNKVTLKFYRDSLKLKEGKYDYISKLCMFIENCIHSLQKDQIKSEINNIKNNNIKNFYTAMYKYIYNIDNYEVDLKKFLQSGQKIYQSIPLKTYVFSDEILNNKKRIKEYKLEKLNYKKDEFLIITSCDINYFNLYGHYILESFKKYHSNINITFIMDIIINKNQKSLDIDNLIKKTNNIKNIDLCLKRTNCENIKAYSSTLRFCRAYYQRENKCLIIDIDSVILKSMKELFLDMNKYDIGTRMLRRRFPWQKYTAGFCFFNNSILSNNILKDIFIFLNNKMRFSEELWWIDQNALVYGIENNTGKEIKIKNYFGSKDKYIISPTGSTESKIKFLKSKIDHKKEKFMLPNKTPNKTVNNSNFAVLAVIFIGLVIFGVVIFFLLKKQKKKK
jgi:hypothetical protein